MKQNSELCIEKEDITPRYLFKDKRHKLLIYKTVLKPVWTYGI